MANRNKRRGRKCITVPCIGPGIIRLCILCGGEIREGEHWRKVGNGAYAVGVHDRCAAGEVRR